MYLVSQDKQADPQTTEPSTSKPPVELLGAVDARFTLAAERTLLAWIRTALGLIAAGVAVMRLLPDFSHTWVQVAIGIALIVVGCAAVIVGGLRWTMTKHALVRGGDLPGDRPIWLLIAAIVVIAVVAGIAGVISAV